MIDPASATRDLPRRDARDKLRGRTRYTVDRARPGMLYAAIRRAATASAKLMRLDLRNALATPGVRAIITADDAPGLHGIGVADQPLFARDRIRYYGEPLAAVAADTLAIAEAAAPAGFPDGPSCRPGRHYHGGGARAEGSARASGMARV